MPYRPLTGGLKGMYTAPNSLIAAVFWEHPSGPDLDGPVYEPSQRVCHSIGVLHTAVFAHIGAVHLMPFTAIDDQVEVARHSVKIERSYCSVLQVLVD